MAEKTTHTEEIRYEVDDHASAALGKLHNALHLTAESTEKSREHVKEFGKETLALGLGALGLGVGLHALGEKVIEAGREFENAQKKITGTLFATAQWGKAASAVDKATASLAMGGEAMEELESIEARFTQPLDDLTAGYDQLALTLGRAKVPIKEIPEYLTLTAAAAKVAGTSVGDAGNLFGKFIATGKIREGAGELGKMLLGLGKVGKVQTPEGRLHALAKRLHEMPAAADVMSTGFDASLKRINIAFDRITRSLTTPLFSAITKDLDEWSKKLMEIQGSGKTLMAEYGDKLLSVFRELKDFAGGIAGHWKEIVGAAAAFKASGMIGGAAGFGSKMLGALGGGGGGAAGGMAGFASKLNLATIGLVGLALAANEFAKFVDKQQGVQIAREAPLGTGGSYDAAFKAFVGYGMKGTGAGGKALAFKQLRSAGLLTEGGAATDRSMLVKALGQDESLTRQLGKELGINKLYGKIEGFQPGQEKFISPERLFSPQIVASAFLDALAGLPKAAAAAVASKPEIAKAEKLAVGGGPPVFNVHNMNITQDFKEQDPDRVYVGLIQGLERHVVAPLTSNLSGPAARP